MFQKAPIRRIEDAITPASPEEKQYQRKPEEAKQSCKPGTQVCPQVCPDPVRSVSGTGPSVSGTGPLRGGLRIEKPEDPCSACTSVQYIYHVTFRRCAECGRESYK